MMIWSVPLPLFVSLARSSLMSIAVEQRLMDIVCRMGQRLTENVLDALVQIDRVCVHLPPSVVIAPDRQSLRRGRLLMLLLYCCCCVPVIIVIGCNTEERRRQ